MNPAEFRQRMRAFAGNVIRLVEDLPKSVATSVMGRQLLRCGTSVGANYRAACRARSRADFVSKMGIVEEECDETIYWLELLTDMGIITAASVEDLMREADEILALVVQSIKTARSRKESGIRNPQSAMGSAQN